MVAIGKLLWLGRSLCNFILKHYSVVGIICTLWWSETQHNI